MTEKYFFDTDCLSAFLWVREESILAKLYEGRIILPAQVYNELQRVPHLLAKVDTLKNSGALNIESMEAGSAEYNDYLQMITSPAAGMRIIGRGEAAGLMWKDLDFDNRMIHVQRSIVWPISNRKGEINTLMKTEAAHRKIPMSPEIYDILLQEKKRSKSLFIFHTRDGSFLSAESFRSMWGIVEYRTIGGPATGHHVNATLDFHVTPHQLRHTCATRWIANGMTPKEAQYLMGHSSPDITMGIYAEYMAEQQLPETAKKISSENLRLAMG